MTETPAADLRYRWVILAVLWITYVVVFLSRLSVGPLAPFFRDELAIGSTQVGLVMSAAALGYTLTQIPVGWLVDRIGARWPIAVGELIAGACMIGVSMSTTYGWLLALMLATGMGCGFLMPATTQAVVVWFPRRERATVMGVKQTAVNIGGIVGAATLPLIAVASAGAPASRRRHPRDRRRPAVAGLLSQSAAIDAGRHCLHGKHRRPARAARAAARAQHLAGGHRRPVHELGRDGHPRPLRPLRDRRPRPHRGHGWRPAGHGQTAGAISRPASGVVSDWLFRGARRPVFLIFAVTATLLCLLIAIAGHSLGALTYPPSSSSASAASASAPSSSRCSRSSAGAPAPAPLRRSAAPCR